MFLRALEALSDSTKVCLFIDGLDEFKDDHSSLISMVTNIIIRNRHVKVCVASRPWNIFQDNLGHEANLRLEDLTFDDIKNFVQSKFKADKEFENLQKRHRSFADQLTDNIVVKASGVFLWVDLVVASLLAGMRLGDRIQDFQRRLDDLPPDLEKLYEKILHDLDPFYLGHAAQYFSLVEAAREPLTVLQFAFADEESPQSAIGMSTGSMTDNEISLRIYSANRRLNSRCKGLLDTDRALQSAQYKDSRLPSQLTVQYLHRTVRDFIKSPKAQEFLRSSTNPDFDPSIQLCVAYLMDIKRLHGQLEQINMIGRDDEKCPFASYIIRCLTQAAGATKANEEAVVELMDELKYFICPFNLQENCFDSVLPQYHAGPLTCSRKKDLWNGSFKDNGTPLISLAVRYGVVPYVKARAERGGFVPRVGLYNTKPYHLKWPLLLDAICDGVPEPRMVECLMEMGADPNFKTSYFDTPWIIALTKATSLYTLEHRFGKSKEYFEAETKWKETLRLMMSSRGGGSIQVPESRLTPITRKILQELEDEEKAKTQSLPNRKSWLSALGLK